MSVNDVYTELNRQVYREKVRLYANGYINALDDVKVYIKELIDATPKTRVSRTVISEEWDKFNNYLNELVDELNKSLDFIPEQECEFFRKHTPVNRIEGYYEDMVVGVEKVQTNNPKSAEELKAKLESMEDILDDPT